MIEREHAYWVGYENGRARGYREGKAVGIVLGTLAMLFAVSVAICILIIIG